MGAGCQVWVVGWRASNRALDFGFGFGNCRFVENDSDLVVIPPQVLHHLGGSSFAFWWGDTLRVGWLNGGALRE